MTIYFCGVLTSISVRSSHDHNQNFINHIFSIIDETVMDRVALYFPDIFLSVFGTIDPGNHIHCFISADTDDPDSGRTHSS